MNLKVNCLCGKNVEPVGQFICSIEPDRHGNYNWLLEKDGKVFGGKARTQMEAINNALKPN